MITHQVLPAMGELRFLSMAIILYSSVLSLLILWMTPLTYASIASVDTFWGLSIHQAARVANTARTANAVKVTNKKLFLFIIWSYNKRRSTH